MKSPLVTVLTATIGRSSLDTLIDSIDKQPCRDQIMHLLLWDDVRAPEAKEPSSFNGQNRFSIVAPPATARYGDSVSGPLLAMGLMAAKTPWVTFADDDIRWEPNHLKTLLDSARGHNWAYSLRRIWTPNGECLGIDRFESIGDQPTRKVDYEMCDSNSVLFKREFGTKGANCFRESTAYNGDRLFYLFLKKYAGPGACTNQPTFNQTCPDRLVDFFKEGCSAE